MKSAAAAKAGATALRTGVSAARRRTPTPRPRGLRLLVGAKYQGHGFVFAGPFGAPLNKDNLRNRTFRRIVKEAKLDKLEPKLRPYDLRHTCATRLLAEGIDAKTVSEWLGHSDVAFTLRQEVHPSHEDKREAADRLGNLIFGEA
jgi:integrase